MLPPTGSTQRNHAMEWAQGERPVSMSRLRRRRVASEQRLRARPRSRPDGALPARPRPGAATRREPRPAPPSTAQRPNALAEILSELLEPEHLNRRQDVEQSFLLITEQLGFLPPELPHPRDEVAGLVLVGATFQQHRLDAPARGLLLGEQIA